MTNDCLVSVCSCCRCGPAVVSSPPLLATLFVIDAFGFFHPVIFDQPFRYYAVIENEYRSSDLPWPDHERESIIEYTIESAVCR